MKYYPEKLGFVFGEGTYRDYYGTLCQWTPYQRACKFFGQKKVIKEVINCIKEYCTSTSTSAGTTTNNIDTATSLLLSAITDESIHVDGVYILFRDNPQGALLRLQEAARAVVVVVRKEKNTGTNVDSNINNNNKSSNSATATATATASNNNNADASSSISKTDTVVAASVIVVGSSTATINNNNNNNNDDDSHNDDDNGNVTQHPLSLASSSSLKGTKRKHEMVSNRS
mmetsp:Transcript_1045/g.1189  ORF Transcript_1045/g.1189 Transcript_1045/m.1189 type:complete len:229 (+) Transcript_1045:1-687(+)